ncbi:MAG: DNA polymerase III subunit alpha [Armatimonadetes bacterium]|nr:DNA polymerase III subunit alpha [Armatimonadota bacterium]MDE2205208.1 DNA polymerase III subunit alpha [Armatimonadota bacterium]
MASSQFVHLHCHSEYSLLDGANRIKPLVRHAAQLGMPALALTDHGVMYGAAEFYIACAEEKIKPLLGVEAYMAPRSRHDKSAAMDRDPWHLLLIAATNEGYRNLLKLTSIAALEGFYGKPRIDREVLEQFSEGVIVTSACLAGEVCQGILDGDYERARDAAAWYREVFGPERYFIELQNHGIPEQQHCNEQLVRIARELRLQLVCSNDVHYLEAEDAEPHDILLCIQTNTNVSDVKRLRYATKEFYLKDHAQMAALFRETPAALENTVQIADRCNVALEFGRCPLPDPDLPEGKSADEYLSQLAYEGMERIWGGTPGAEVRSRLSSELQVIEQTGFAPYILIVRDFAQFARQRKMFFGVRGSAAASLVSYAVGIVDVNPLEFGLTFERFLNVERKQMPDVDMDFEDARRAEVIEYVTQKYSPDQQNPLEARVAQITTFGTMAARAAIKDSARALGLHHNVADSICRLMPKASSFTIQEALDKVPEFATAVSRDPELQRLISVAQKLEGIARHKSVHAAGVIISRDPLVNYTALGRSDSGLCVTQYPAPMLAQIGLLKMDFLGLINLTILAQTLRSIEATTGAKVDFDTLPETDARTFELLGGGECIGVFQLESEKMRQHIRELKPESVRDLAAMVALYRPGPIDEISKFISCRHGRSTVKSIHPLLDPILADTYGVIVYQEQVLEIARAVAGYSLGQADVFRSAIGKKNATDLDQQRAAFLNGAAAKGVPAECAERIFDLILPFAGYGFNKAHAVCYAKIAYKTAWLKANYPRQFMAALMDCFKDKGDRLAVFVEEARRMGLRVEPPDINRSGADFTLEEADALETEASVSGSIRFGLTAIRGVGRNAADRIVSERDRGGAFVSFAQFMARVGAQEGSSVNRAVLEALVHCGALDGVAGDTTRRGMAESLDAMMRRAARDARNEKQGNQTLFVQEDANQPAIDDGPSTLPEYHRTKLLSLERELLGVYISGHPMADMAPKLRRAGITFVKQLADAVHGEQVLLAGIITSIDRRRVKKSAATMAHFTLEDPTGAIACTMFPRAYEETGSVAQADAWVTVRAKVSVIEIETETDEADRRIEILVNSVEAMTDARPGTGIAHVLIHGDRQPHLATVRNAVGRHEAKSGGLGLLLHIRHSGTEYVLQTGLKVNDGSAFRTDIERITGSQTVWTD